MNGMAVREEAEDGSDWDTSTSPPVFGELTAAASPHPPLGALRFQPQLWTSLAEDRFQGL